MTKTLTKFEELLSLTVWKMDEESLPDKEYHRIDKLVKDIWSHLE